MWSGAFYFTILNPILSLNLAKFVTRPHYSIDRIAVIMQHKSNSQCETCRVVLEILWISDTFHWNPRSTGESRSDAVRILLKLIITLRQHKNFIGTVKLLSNWKIKYIFQKFDKCGSNLQLSDVWYVFYVFLQQNQHYQKRANLFMPPGTAQYAARLQYFTFIGPEGSFAILWLFVTRFLGRRKECCPRRYFQPFSKCHTKPLKG